MVLKNDLKNHLTNEKHYAEMELSRLVYNDNILTYKEKIDKICATLGDIMVIETKLNAIEHYFIEKNETNEEE